MPQRNLFQSVTTSDSTLLLRMRSGDERAFEALHARYRAELERYARRMLRDAGPAAEDVVQEALFRAYRKLNGDRREVAVRPYFYRCVHNGCLDELRRNTMRHADAVPEPASDDDDPAALLARREKLRDVLRDVAALPSRQRGALLAVTVSGSSYEALARDLGTTAAGAKALVRRARLGVRSHFDESLPLAA